MSSNSTKVIVLVAGQGTRLRPLTDNKPKALVKFIDKAIIDYQISAYHKNNLKDIYLVTGYKHEMFNHLEIAKVYNENYLTTNMVASLYKARHLFDGENNILISYGDIIFESDVVTKMISDVSNNISIIYDLNWLKLWSQRMENPLADVESFSLDENNDLIELGNEVNDIKKIEGQYIGMIHVRKDFAPHFFELYENALKSGLQINGINIPNLFMTSYLQHLIDNGVKVRGIPIHGGWLEIDSVEDLQSYEELQKNQELKSLIDIENI